MKQAATMAESLFCRRNGGDGASDAKAFDLHVVASILAISLSEAAAEGLAAHRAVGLAAAELSALLCDISPHLAMAPSEGDGGLERGEEEACLFDLLNRGATGGTPFEAMLAAMIARRAMRPHHLWQDLGLRNRDELSRLMSTHFAPLAARNRRDMKWKKFFYRMICRDADYALCTAPSCGECGDFEKCFGEETGECLLAQVRKGAETATCRR
jgi:nitrogen fixation protein NifQ